MGHLELAECFERAIWVPLSDQNLHYDGVNNSALVLCSVKKTHEGEYRCRVSNDCSGSVLSEVVHVELVKPDGECVHE